MPNTVTLNSGTGGELLTTDQIIEAGVTVQVQYVKLMSGTALSTAAIGGTIADGLLVDLRNVSGAISVSAQANVNWPVSGKVSGVGTFLISGDVSADPSATFFVATSVDRAVDVSADPSATFFIATSVDRAVSVSAQGAVNWAVSGKVSGVGTFLISGDVSADPSATFFVASSADTGIAISAQAGAAIPVSADPTSTFFVATSGNRFVCVHPNISGSASPMSANGTFEPLRYVYINASAAGDTTLVAAVAGQSTRVIGYAFICPTSAMPVFFRDTEATTIPKVHAAFTPVTGGGVVFAGSIYAPAFQTTVGTGIELHRGATADAVVQGHMTFLMVTN